MAADEQPEEEVTYEMLREANNRMIETATTVTTELSDPRKKLTEDENTRLRMARETLKLGKETLKTLDKISSKQKVKKIEEDHGEIFKEFKGFSSF